ncbi:DUF59 domain-containing protein [candidate division WOR-3 bacterium]|nr:DUF59 domain-containing protein [candidate division WOR-3 bacterium]
MSLREKIIDKLKTIEDPEVHTDVLSLKLVYDLNVDEENKTVSLKFKPTVPNCPIGVQLAINLKRNLMEVEGVKKINVEVTDFIMAEQANEYLKMLDEKK